VDPVPDPLLFLIIISKPEINVEFFCALPCCVNILDRNIFIFFRHFRVLI
jgi:hypothetical protein